MKKVNDQTDVKLKRLNDYCHWVQEHSSTIKQVAQLLHDDTLPSILKAIRLFKGNPYHKDTLNLFLADKLEKEVVPPQFQILKMEDGTPIRYVDAGDSWNLQIVFYEQPSLHVLLYPEYQRILFVTNAPEEPVLFVTGVPGEPFLFKGELKLPSMTIEEIRTKLQDISQKLEYTFEEEEYNDYTFM